MVAGRTLLKTEVKDKIESIGNMLDAPFNVFLFKDIPVIGD